MRIAVMPLAVRKITGVTASRSSSAARTAHSPSQAGIITSLITRSGSSSWLPPAWSPSLAVVT